MTTTLTFHQHKNLETFILVWLDSLVNTSQDNIDAKILFRKSINRLNTFDNINKCTEFIQSVSYERIVLIVSGRLGQIIVPKIHHLPQLIAIYVYCSDKNRHSQWSKDFSKIKGVIVDLNELIKKIQLDQTKRNEYKIDEPLPISVYNTKSEHNNENNNNFINNQLLIDCLCRMKCNTTDKNELFSLCEEEYKENNKELDIVNEFKEKYSSNQAIWWLTRESFICRILNKAFQVMNIDLLYYFHFFIHDIYQQLKKNKCSSTIRTYRAQLMSTKELQLLNSSVGEFISINTFLSTIANRKRALSIFENTYSSDDVKQVLFEIHAQPQQNDNKPFSNISSLNYMIGTEVILFMAGTIFHINNIEQKNNITIVQMDISNDNNKDIRMIIDKFKNERYYNEPNLLSFGHILSKMKKFDVAEKYYKLFLEEMPNDHHSIVRCYEELGNIAMEKQDYDSSILWYQKALDINQSILRSQDPAIASQCNMIANIYMKQGIFDKAIELYAEALNIWIQALGKDHLKVGLSYKNLGYAFLLKKNYSNAIDYFKQALIIYEKNRSSNSSDIAEIHNHIGTSYISVNNIEQALKHYNIALQIYTNIYPETHINVMTTIKNINSALEVIDDLKRIERF